MRVFIGLPLSESMQGTLKQAWNNASENPAGKRPMRSSLWHVTLAFLGEVDPSAIDPLAELVSKTATHPPKGGFSIDRFETFPKKKPARIVAHAVPEHVDSWRHFVHHLRDMASIVAPQIDRKPWIPHISITRALKKNYLQPWNESFDPISWKPSELAIIQSTPGPHGSIYKHLHVFPLDV